MSILVTGGAGFIGSNFVVDWLNTHDEKVINLDLLTYAGNRDNLKLVQDSLQHIFVRGDIGDTELIASILSRYQPRAVINFAAESHVDRSIIAPEEFIQTNVVGTCRLLDMVRLYWSRLSNLDQGIFRFLHISTDEVYGTLLPDEPAFAEHNRYQPNSPYSASKAASDHLVRSYFHTYNLPTLTINCSNNYGPYQFPEKLIPLVINNALTDSPIPIYGDGRQARDWLYVLDHCSAIQLVLDSGQPGEVYNVGGASEKTNLEVVNDLCGILDKCQSRKDGRSYAEQIIFVKDRPGHDYRYAINASKIKNELGWRPKDSFASGIHKTVDWYLNNQNWVMNVTSGKYGDWIKAQYA